MKMVPALVGLAAMPVTRPALPPPNPGGFSGAGPRGGPAVGRSRVAVESNVRSSSGHAPSKPRPETSLCRRSHRSRDRARIDWRRPREEGNSFLSVGEAMRYGMVFLVYSRG